MAEARDGQAAATATPGSAASARGPSLAGRRFVSSWSGGKDAYLALQRAAAAGGRPAALGVPLVTVPTTWDGYEAAYVGALTRLRAKGVSAGVFGDVDLQEHRDWVEKVCDTAGVSCHLPLWNEDRRTILRELLDAGVRATVIAVDRRALGARFVGRTLDDDLIAELEAAGVDLCGEGGEYHTVVTAVPLLSRDVEVAWDGCQERDGHWVVRFAVPDRPRHGSGVA